MKHPPPIPALLLAFVLLLAACTKDDYAQCPGEVKIFFSLLSSESNPLEVDQMHLYIFNNCGTYLREYRDNAISRFDAQYFLDCPNLAPGSYRFVAWAGKENGCYATTPAPFIPGKTTYKEALLLLKHAGGVVESPMHHLFHSELQVAVTNQKDQRFTMPLTQLTNTIRVRIEGLPLENNTYILRIADNNCAYTFDRSFALHEGHPSGETITYTTHCTQDDSGHLNATLRVMRLMGSRRIPQLAIVNQADGKLLFPLDDQSGDLIEMILEAYTPNFDTTHTYDIVLRFFEDDSTGLKVTVSINGWDVQSEENELID